MERAETPAKNSGRILLVDDEQAVRTFVSAHLKRRGYNCQACSDGRAALDLLGAGSFDVVLASVEAAGLGGVGLLEELQHLDRGLPVILLGTVWSSETAVRALQLGAYDFLLKPFSMNALDSAIERARERRQLQRETLNDQMRLERMVQEKTVHLLTAREKLEEQADALRSSIALLEENFDATVTAMVNAIEARDSETRNHCRRARAYTLLIAEQLDLDGEALRNIGWGALLHDVGKIGVPDDILLKKGPLTPEEWVLMKRHPEIGYQMIRDISFLENASTLVLAHHEKWDGSGYPNGIRGEEIPIGARCFAIADAVEAITSKRCYKPAFSFEEARQRIRAGQGTHFDPQLVDLFLGLPTQAFEDVREHFLVDPDEVIDAEARARAPQIAG